MSADDDFFMFRHLLDEPDQQTRLDELLVDSEGWDKGLSAFEIYLEECFDFPFQAKFRSKKYGDTKSVFTVLRVSCSKDKGGVFCEIQFKNQKKREVPVCCITPTDRKHKRNIAFNDYLSWLPFTP
ncbi:hypothetical protein HZC09_01535 [Candidatus Micrarchaeota archaeon]|nr:hypothetical protein [Candidatus Micrarchaeota archaeon]